MTGAKTLLLVVCTVHAVAGSLQYWGQHQHHRRAGNGNFNRVSAAGGGRFAKPGEPPRRFVRQRPPPPPLAGLPQLYSTPDIAQIAIEPADEFTQLPSGPPIGIGDTLPDFVQPDFGGWIPMTSEPAPQTGNFGSSSSSALSQQSTGSNFVDQQSLSVQQPQLPLQAVDGNGGFSSAFGPSSSSSQEELLTNAWSQAPQSQSGGGTGLPSSYVPQEQGNGGSFSQGNTVPTLLKPLGLPQPEQSFSQSPSQSFVGGNTDEFTSFPSSSEVGNSIPEGQFVSTSLKPLGLPQPDGFTSQVTVSGGENNNFVSSTSQVGSSFPQGNQVQIGGFSQSSFQTGGNGQSSFSSEGGNSFTQGPIPTELKPLGLPQPESQSQFVSQTSGGGSTNLPSSYVPPSTGSTGTFSQNGPVPTNLKPIDLPQPDEFSQSSFQTGGGANIDSSFSSNFGTGSSFEGSYGQEGFISTELKPLNLPQTEQSSNSFSSQSFGGNTVTSSTFSSSSPDGGSFFSNSQQSVTNTLQPLASPNIEPVPTLLKPLGLPQPQGPIPTDLKPLNIPTLGQPTSQQTFQENITPLNPSYVPPSSQGVDSFSQEGAIPDQLKPLGLLQTSQSSSQTNGGNLILPDFAVPAQLKPLGLPQPDGFGSQSSSQTNGENLLLPDFQGSAQLKPLGLPQPDGFGSQSSSQTNGENLLLPDFQGSAQLKPLGLPQPDGFGSQSSSQTNGENLLLPDFQGSAQLKPLGLPQPDGFGSQFSSQTNGENLLLPDFQGSAQLKPLGLPQPDGFGSQSSSQTNGENLLLPDFQGSAQLKPLGLPQPDGFGSQSSSQSNGENLILPDFQGSAQLKPLGLPQPDGPAYQPSSQTNGGDLILPGFPVTAQLKPLGLPQPDGFGSQSSSQTNEGSLILPDFQGSAQLKPLGLPQPDGFGSQSSSQTNGENLLLPDFQGSAQLKPLGLPQPDGFGSQFSSQTNGENLLLPDFQGSAQLKPLGLPQPDGFGSQSSSQTNGDNSGYTQPSSSQPSFGEEEFSQGNPVPVLLKPLGLPPQTSEQLSQFGAETSEGQDNGASFAFASSSEGGDASFSQGGVTTGGSASFVSQQGTTGNSAYVEPSSEVGNYPNGEAGPGPQNVPTELKPLGLPPTDESAFGSAASFSGGSGGSSYNPSSQEGGSSQVSSSSGEFSSQFSQETDSGFTTDNYQPTSGNEGSSFTTGPVGPPSSLPSSRPVNAGNVPTILKPLDLPQQNAVEPEQNFVQASFQTTGPTDVDQSNSLPGDEYAENQPLLSGQTPSNSETSSEGELQSASVDEFGSANSQLFPESEDVPNLPTPSGFSTDSFGTTNGGNYVQPTPQDSEPVFGIAASGNIGSSVPFPRPPRPQSSGQTSTAGGSVIVGPPGSPPGFGFGDRFPTGPSNVPDIPVGGGEAGGSSSGGVTAFSPGGGSGGSGTGSGGGGTIFTIGTDGSESSVSGGDSDGEVSFSAGSGGGGQTGGSGTIFSAGSFSGGAGASGASFSGAASNNGGSFNGGAVGSGTGSSEGSSSGGAGSSGGGFSGGAGANNNGNNGGSGSIGSSSGTEDIGSGGSVIGNIGGGGGSGFNNAAISGGVGSAGVGISSSLDTDSASISNIAGTGISGGSVGISSSGSGGGGSGSISSSGGSSNVGNSGGPVEILSQTFQIDEGGNYQYSYEQSDGHAAEEQGRFTPGSEPETGTMAATGSYRYIGPDGREYSVTYTADERGFLPTGDHLPKAPEQIPEYAELRSRYPGLFWAERLRVRDPDPEQ